jgi:hypothetical protein
MQRVAAAVSVPLSSLPKSGLPSVTGKPPNSVPIVSANQQYCTTFPRTEIGDRDEQCRVHRSGSRRYGRKDRLARIADDRFS